jgi:death on curing protein
MISLNLVLKLHENLIVRYGGSNGVRDEGALMGAIGRPYSGFGETEFYPTAEEKGAAILESIIKNHPFVDGNKRTGFLLMRIIVENEGKIFKTTEDENYNFVIAVASGKMEYDQILAWIKSNL